MDLREKILASDFEFLPNPLDGFNPLSRERAKILEPLRRKLHNETPPISRYSYSETVCQRHKNSFVSRILKTLEKSRLQGYSLHTGQAFSIRYYGPSLQFEEEVSEEVFELRNRKEGFCLQFRIVERTAHGPAIHALFIIRDTTRQGSFYEIKRILVEELWRQVLEPAGFGFLYGRAVWSSNSEIRHACPRSKDWREALCYAGLDRDLSPVLIPGLRLLYYRLGFVQMGVLDNGFTPEYVALLSSAAAKKIKDSLADETWQEITHYSHSNAKCWRQIVTEREACLGVEELESRIAVKRSQLASQNQSI